MKATDLMIGDWVKLSKGNWSKNRQVGLTDIEMIAESVYLAEPIPLTPEILEKNGGDTISPSRRGQMNNRNFPSKKEWIKIGFGG